eukprot:maker-scaffold_20-snap-gene-5.6-mRNA-1 protein AED:0.01 eAED:0.01 QI:109/1/1/1/1/1/2/591/320
MHNRSEESILSTYGKRQLLSWTQEPLKCIKYDTLKLDGKVALITLSRPEKRNAWTEVMRNEIVYAIETANRDNNVRVIVITGDPAGKAFCFGADLSPSSASNPSSMEGDWPTGRPESVSTWRDGGGQAGLAIAHSLKPVIAAVNGSAVGVGMTLPLSCDISVAAEDAKVGFVFGKRGLAMECCSSFFLERCVGHKTAMELVLTGRVFLAKDSPAGLFNYILPKEEVLGKALSLAGEICETSPMSCMYNRNMLIRNGYSTSPEEAHLVESKVIYTCMGSEDFNEGVKSFLQKRKAEYPMDPFKDRPSFFPWWKQVETRSKL